MLRRTVTAVEGTRIVGREAELREIDEMLAEACSAPASLLIAGEAGIGKSTL